ncbi:unnamed protein product [Effrenium voratum]|uniref:Sulfotransferase n=1 Tax=Effrenium voratum TaxID=2562239 RepID=A0AA36HZ76_9DINO|nr:unnamed protein product [Effrenium voratum]
MAAIRRWLCALVAAVLLAVLHLRHATLLVAQVTTTRAKAPLEEQESPVPQESPVQVRRPDPTFKETGHGARCLKFIHIPKTGGTSIEYELWLKREQLRGLPQWGVFDHNISCKNKHEFRPAVPNVGQVLAYGCKSPAGHGGCPAWHVPPGADDLLLEGYQQCDTFCVVRHPVTRLVSKWKYTSAGPNCSREDFTKWAFDMLEATQKDPYQGGCHFIPQSEYIWQKGTGLTTCDHVLRYENLTAEFDSLMSKFELPIALKVHQLKANPRCTWTNVTPEVEQRTKEVYAADFKLLGYT